jgi:hypothetical protein
MNPSRIWKAGALSLVVLGWTLAGCGSATNPTAPTAHVPAGTQPPGPQDEVGPPGVPPAPGVPSGSGNGHDGDRDRVSG